MSSTHTEPTTLRMIIDSVSAAFPTSSVDEVMAPIGGAPVNVVRMTLPPSAHLYFLPSTFFPDVPPTLFVHWGEGIEREHMSLNWPVDGDPVQKFETALRMFVQPSTHYRVAYGSSPERPLTEDAEIARRAGWRRVLTGAPLVPSTHEIASARIDVDVADAFRRSNVLIVGLGSVGSYMAEQFVRSGVGHLGLVDYDVVEESNISRTIFDRSDVGRPKASAIERKLLNIAPDLELTIGDTSLQAMDPERLREMFFASDLVIAATDDPIAQAHVNSCAQFADRPALFIGLYRGAKGGEISVVIPQLTPCFRCQIGATRLPSTNGIAVAREVDYGTGRLRGEIALNCDIQHVSSAGLRLSMSLLAALKGVQGSLSEFLIGAVQSGVHLLTMGMEPNWWFYPEVFAETSGQYAFQSVWLRAEGRPDCPDCGISHERADPFTSLAGDIDVQELRRLIDG